jgi:multidrug efflux pump subunit AcrB
VGLAALGLAKVPRGFVPSQDKGYLVAFAQLPDAATLDRTEGVIRQMSEIARKQPGVASAVAFPGLSINGFVNASNSGIVFVTLKPEEDRKGKRIRAPAPSCRRSTGSTPASRRPRGHLPAAGAGPGSIGDLALVEDRDGSGFETLYTQVQNAMNEGRKRPGWPDSSPVSRSAFRR